MTTGYFSNYNPGGEQDLDVIFEAGSTPGTTGFPSVYRGGVDLAAIFAPRSSGADIGYNTGFVALDGRDLREWFCKIGTAVRTLWTGSVTIANANSGQFYGFYRTQGGNVYWGGSTDTGGVGPRLRGFQYEPALNRTWAIFDSNPNAAQITMTYDGLSTQMIFNATDDYWCTGDFWNLAGRVGGTFNGQVVTV
jgi:hypothetical protein